MVLSIGSEPPLPTNTISTNGSSEESLERYKIREIMEGFPCHRDACEWSKMRSLFADEEAYVYTTWSGGVSIDNFIKISKEGFENGVQIAHRANGATVDLATVGKGAGKRAVGKLKATITQRFSLPSINGGESVVDIEADCRLCFLLERKDDGNWKTHFFKGIYEKDRIIPVLPHKIPQLDEEKLQKFPEGYRHLAYAQSAKYNIKMDLPQLHGLERDKIYNNFIEWLNGIEISRMKELLA